MRCLCGKGPEGHRAVGTPSFPAGALPLYSSSLWAWAWGPILQTEQTEAQSSEGSCLGSMALMPTWAPDVTTWLHTSSPSRDKSPQGMPEPWRRQQDEQSGGEGPGELRGHRQASEQLCSRSLNLTGGRKRTFLSGSLRGLTEIQHVTLLDQSPEHTLSLELLANCHSSEDGSLLPPLPWPWGTLTAQPLYLPE